LTTPDTAIADTQAWLEKAVIGLNLCPFAKAVHSKGQIRWVLSSATTTQALLQTLTAELHSLQAANPAVVDTTVIVHPQVLQNFSDFNEFLGEAEDLLVDLALDGTLQIASFHPQFQFADTAADDISNCTNRSPYPTLHLLRESSVDRAVAAYPEAEAIYQRNIETLRRLGASGWAQLLRKR
jgi:uncharacterized protein